MGRLFVLFFLMPWWAYIPASIGVYWLGERMYEQALETELDKASALEAGMPQAVDLTDFDRDRDTHPAEEVHVTGWINADLNYELIKKRNGVTTGTRHMYMMFGSADPMGAREVRAAVMLSPGEREVFLDGGYLEDSIVGLTDAGELVFAFNGFADTSHSFGSLAADALEEKGLAKADDFVFIEPFLQGREAALAPHGVSDQTRYIGWIAAAIVALIGVIKRIRSVRARPVHGAEGVTLKSDEDLAAYTPPPPEAPASSFTVPEGVSEDTPLGRLARRNAAAAAPAREETLSYSGYSTLSDPDPAADREDEDMFGAPSDATDSYDAAVRFDEADGAGYAPGGESAAEPAPARSSATAFYAKVALGMLLVGMLAYDPSLLTAVLPVSAVLLFWFGVFAVVRKLRNGAARVIGGSDRAPRHTRRPDAGAQPVAAGIDLGGPVRSSRRERGVI